jgi:hypothetical protein
MKLRGESLQSHFFRLKIQNIVKPSAAMNARTR